MGDFDAREGCVILYRALTITARCEYRGYPEEEGRPERQRITKRSTPFCQLLQIHNTKDLCLCTMSNVYTVEVRSVLARKDAKVGDTILKCLYKTLVHTAGAICL